MLFIPDCIICLVLSNNYNTNDFSSAFCGRTYNQVDLMILHPLVAQHSRMLVEIKFWIIAGPKIETCLFVSKLINCIVIVICDQI